jgi:hypothetical protein
MIKRKITQEPYTKGRRVLTRTGPLMLTHATSFAQEDICHLNTMFSSPSHQCGYIKELGGKSWHEADFQIYNFFVANGNKLLIFFMLFMFIVVTFAIIYTYHKHINKIDFSSP